MMKAGKYFIGDPCYAVKDELWSEFCDKSISNETGVNDGIVELQGAEIFFTVTKYGDGVYEDELGNDYPVDAGIIGATPLDKGITENDMDKLRGCGVVVDIKHDFDVERVDEDGMIVIDKYEIYTGDE